MTIEVKKKEKACIPKGEVKVKDDVLEVVNSLRYLLSCSAVAEGPK